MSDCEVSLVQDTLSDLMVVNAARVSLAKHHTKFNPESDIKLINFLARNNHWTPFAHSNLYFIVNWSDYNKELYFYRYSSTAGRDIKIIESNDHYHSSRMLIRGSLYFWINNYRYFQDRNTQNYILKHIYAFYPYTFKAFNLPEHFDYDYNHVYLYHHDVSSMKDRVKFNDIYAVTLRIKCPIFIARQIRTSHIGIAYSDSDSLHSHSNNVSSDSIYSEGESFVYNEVSRRYVDTEPEFYDFKEYTLREGSKVKQGHTSIATENQHSLIQNIHHTALDMTKEYYEMLLMYRNSPEQARAILPQSMMTEFYMTASVKRWKDWLALRLDEHVQKETRELAEMVREVLDMKEAA